MTSVAFSFSARNLFHVPLPRNLAPWRSPVFTKESPETEYSAAGDKAIEAEILLRRAKELREEAKAMEIALEARKASSMNRKLKDIDHMMNKLFVNERPMTAEAVARILREERFSQDQLEKLLEALWKRLNPSVTSIQITETADSVNISGTVTSTNQTESELVQNYIQVLLDASELLDNEKLASSTQNWRWSGRVKSQLKSRLNEWRRASSEDFKRRLTADIQAAIKSNGTVQEYMRKSLGLPSVEAFDTGKNQSLAREQVAAVPLWIPSSFLSYVIASRSTVDPIDVRSMKERVLTKTRFFCTSSDSVPYAAIFRGNIRPSLSESKEVLNDPSFTATVFNEVQNAMDREGFSKRLQLFLLPDPEWQPTRDKREPLPKPVFLVLPKDIAPNDSSTRQSFTAILFKQLTAISALGSVLYLALENYALNPKVFDAIVKFQDISIVRACFPIVAGVLAIQLSHELAHLVVAKKRDIKIGLPLLIPSMTLGTYGCITPLRSFPPNRAALLDFSLSGPLVASIFSLLLMVIGCYKTIYASNVALMKFPFMPVGIFKSSFLTGSILTFFLPKAMTLPLSQPIPIHPFFVTGFFGLITNALNLLPIFRLDGGRASSAVLGTRVSAIGSAWFLLSVLSIALSGSTVAWTWGMFVLLFQRKPEIPSRDDVTVVDDVRKGVWVSSVVLALLALLPFPGGMGIL